MERSRGVNQGEDEAKETDLVFSGARELREEERVALNLAASSSGELKGWTVGRAEQMMSQRWRGLIDLVLRKVMVLVVVIWGIGEGRLKWMMEWSENGNWEGWIWLGLRPVEQTRSRVWPLT